MLDNVEFLTVTEVANIFRVEKRTVYNAIKRGQIPAVRVGREYRIPRSFIEAVKEAGKEGLWKKVDQSSQ